MSTKPVNSEGQDATPNAAPVVVVAPFYKDPTTGALYVHEDLEPRVEPWEESDHIGPIKRAETFGDVESWVAYVQRFAPAPPVQDVGMLVGPEVLGCHLTWNSKGLAAILDYPTPSVADRCQWTARYAFRHAPEWDAWMALASGKPLSQAAAIEALEDRSLDIVDPSPADLLGILRNLRATVNASAQTELNPDGSTSVAFTQDKALRGGGSASLTLPPEFSIAIRVLAGHVDLDGKPVLYKLGVRLRVSIDNAAHLTMRFTLPGLDRALEDVYADRVAHARQLIGPQYTILRAGE